MKILSATVEH